MFQVLVILICVVAVITGFFSILWGWIILGIPIAFLLITFLSIKQKKWSQIPELSNMANQMLQKYGHYYAMPFAGRDFSASASTLMFAGAAIALIGVFKGFWWGIGFGIINWVVMGIVSKAFNPTNFIADPFEKVAHEEIISYLTKKKLA